MQCGLNRPCEGIMNSLDEFEVADRITTESRAEVLGEFLEVLQIVAELNAFDVVDDVQKRNGRAGIFHGLSRLSEY